MNVHFLYTTLVLLTTIAIYDCARILAVLPINVKSHHYVLQPFIRALAEKGHDITLYTSIELGANYTNIREISIHLPNVVNFGSMSFSDFRKFGEVGIVSGLPFWEWGLSMTEDALSGPEIQKLIHSDDKYDLIILETHFAQEAFMALGHKFNAPVVTISSFTTFTFIDEFLGNPFAISYVPGFEVYYSNDMSFIQRCHNTLRVISTLLIGHYYYLPYQDNLMRKYFKYPGSETIPPLAHMLSNVSMVILNSQIAVDYPRPLVPNVIGVAGLHIAPKNKPLPKDLKQFLDNSKHGVIYVSFGSIMPADKMPAEMKDAFINTFKKLKHDVLWKMPLDTMPDLPKNVKLKKWVPQQDVLAHSNIKAFITHGGLLSQEEAVYYGVPVIGVPFFGDQGMNVNRAAKDGYCIYLDSFNITEESVTWAINEILNNPMYQENIKLRSRIFHDNPEPPIQKAMYWIEYVMRHNGAHHLRSYGRNFSYFKYLLLDVFAFLALIAFLFVFSISFVIKNISFLFLKKVKTVSSSKKVN